MEKKVVMEKYPIMTITFDKQEIICDDINSIVNYLIEKINSDKIARYIATFEHYEHTTSIGGEIAQYIRDAKNLIFCFGPKIPNEHILALRPRSFGIVDIGDKIVINFLEAPIEHINQVMVEWVMSLKK